MEGKRSLKERSEFIIEDDFLDDDIEEFESSGGFDEKKKGVAMKRSGGGSGGASPPSCQVEKCGVDLSEAKRYHRRHKVCETHSKAPAVLVSGLRQRFCQQCSRFHELLEFDDAKRSCRRRLAGHNERRRKSSDGEGSNRKGSIKESQCERAKYQITIPTPPGNSTHKRSQIR